MRLFDLGHINVAASCNNACLRFIYLMRTIIIIIYEIEHNTASTAYDPVGNAKKNQRYHSHLR